MKRLTIFMVVFIQTICAIAQQVGSKVSFRAVDGKIYTGSINEIKGDQYKVKYDGFDFEAWLKKDQFTVTEYYEPTPMLRVNVFADDDNSSIPEATIYAEGSTYVGLYRGISDQSGTGTVLMKSGGEFVVSVSHPKFLSAQQLITINRYGDQQTYTLNFRLKRKKEADKELKPFHVYVKDKQNKPISGATVSVSPGESGATDGNGYVKAFHSQQPGEYVRVIVQARGYKDQEKRILVGTKQGGAITRAEDGANFVLEKGENERPVFTIVAQVLDYESDKPVSGANVKLKLSDGFENTAITNNNGEASLKDPDGISFQGTTGKVMVTHPDYEEKWSDIAAELMTATDGIERQFVVYVKKKNVEKKADPRFLGTWKCECKLDLVFNADGTGAWIDYRGGPPGSFQESGRYDGTWSSSGNMAYLTITKGSNPQRYGTSGFTLSNGKLYDPWGTIYVK